MPKAVRTVITARPRPGKGGRPLMWGFTVEDFAAFFDLTVTQTRRRIRIGRFDPASLDSILAYKAHLDARRARRRPVRT